LSVNSDNYTIEFSLDMCIWEFFLDFLCLLLEFHELLCLFVVHREKIWIKVKRSIKNRGFFANSFLLWYILYIICFNTAFLQVFMLKRTLIILGTIIVVILCASVMSSFGAGLQFPDGSETIIQEPSIQISTNSWNAIEVSREFAFKVLGLLKILVSGVALIYIVLIGVYMVVFSENEERVKMQRKQFIYTLIGFLFLNIPWAIYTAINPEDKRGGSIGSTCNWSDTICGSVFWDTYGFEGFLGNLIAFFRVFLFGVAILTFTWWIFQLIIAGWDDEKQKAAKGRITYGVLGLIFMGFVEWWGRIFSEWDFSRYIPYIGNKLFGIALFLAAPIAIFFLIWWAYQFITSAGDEEKLKKGKAIVTNTFIATLILLAAMSFLTDLITFKL